MIRQIVYSIKKDESHSLFLRKKFSQRVGDKETRVGGHWGKKKVGKALCFARFKSVKTLKKLINYFLYVL